MGLEAWVESGRIADLVLLVLVIEAVIVAIAWRRSAAGLQLLAGLVAGGCLVLALRAALVGQGTAWIFLYLALALLAHLIELRLVWARR